MFDFYLANYLPTNSMISPLPSPSFFDFLNTHTEKIKGRVNNFAVPQFIKIFLQPFSPPH